MKLMKHITIALVLCAIPAMAFGQTVSCEACTHDVSVYMGEGGFIAEADDADEVTYVATCGGVTRSGKLEADDDGMVAMLFSMDNGLACHDDDEDNRLQVGPVMDGGWYWLTLEDNSAVGALVSQDILDNETVDITDAGEGVTMMKGRGAVLLTETSTGRVGVLPNIMPEPPAAPAEVCGPRRQDAWPYTFSEQMSSSCMLGGGRTKIRLIGPGQYNSRGMITTGMVTRPTTGDITVNADLWVDESGSYTTTASDGGTFGPDLRKGWPGKTHTGLSDHNTNWLDASFVVTLHSGDPQTGDLAGAGVVLTEAGTGSSPTGQATITISASADYCPSSASDPQHTATLNIAAVPGTNAIHPPVAVGRAAGYTSSSLATVTHLTQLRIVCAPRSGSNHQGQDLVPDNPFPTEE